MRILPEMCASTLCPLSSSTRNCVLGNASVTVPSTSITSSLAKDLLSQTATRWLEPNGYLITPAPALTPLRSILTAVLGQHPRDLVGYGDGVLEVGGEGAVRGVDGPAVPLAEADVVAAGGDHWLDGEGHPREEARPGTWPAVVGDLGVLVHLAPDAVGD